MANECSKTLASVEVLGIDKGVSLLTSLFDQVNGDQHYSLVKDLKLILEENLVYRHLWLLRGMLMSTQCESAGPPKVQGGGEQVSWAFLSYQMEQQRKIGEVGCASLLTSTCSPAR